MSHAPPEMQATHASLVKPKFAGVVLVCRECQKRSNGPPKLKARDVQKEFRRDAAALPMRLRIVQSSCLGLCPKKAIAVAAMTPGRPLCAAELRSADAACAVIAALQQPR